MKIQKNIQRCIELLFMGDSKVFTLQDLKTYICNNETILSYYSYYTDEYYSIVVQYMLNDKVMTEEFLRVYQIKKVPNRKLKEIETKKFIRIESKYKTEFVEYDNFHKYYNFLNHNEFN